MVNEIEKKEDEILYESMKKEGDQTEKIEDNDENDKGDINK